MLEYFSLNISKIEDAGELPGLMIEEMMESASMVNGEETDQAAKDNVQVRLILAFQMFNFIKFYPFSERGWLSVGSRSVFRCCGGATEGSSQVETVHASQHGRPLRAPAGGLDSGEDGQVREPGLYWWG